MFSELIDHVLTLKPGEKRMLLNVSEGNLDLIVLLSLHILFSPPLLFLSSIYQGNEQIIIKSHWLKMMRAYPMPMSLSLQVVGIRGQGQAPLKRQRLEDSAREKHSCSVWAMTPTRWW